MSFEESARFAALKIDADKPVIVARSVAFSTSSIEGKFDRHDGTPGRFIIFRDKGTMAYDVETQPPTRASYQCSRSIPRF